MAAPSSLYIHVPFCERKCNYCAFESAVPDSVKDIWLWLEMLAAEMKLRCAGGGPIKLKTCYIGGGTPTMLLTAHWKLLIRLLENYFDFDKNAEVTIEANPNSLRADQLAEWREWRVTRVSIGVQSFDDAELEQMGRLHTAGQAHDAISASLASGFSVSADFMFGLPGQSFQNWGRTLKGAARCGLHHISLYQLSIEPGTPWAGIAPESLGDGYAAYRYAQWYLPKKGYAQYEVANFAQPGKESRHNINYWREGPYLGLGPGAAGYIDGVRYKNHGTFAEWQAALEAGSLPEASSERLTADARAGEAAMLGLRMTSGINAKAYAAEYGAQALSALEEKLAQFPKDLYAQSDGRIFLTPKGMRVANRIWQELV